MHHSPLITRRRLLVAASVSLAGTAPNARARALTSATPIADVTVDQLIVLSETLCGGGRFDPDRAGALLTLLTGDETLNAGLHALLAMPAGGVGGDVTPSTSAPAQAVAETILLYWYTGYVGDEPVVDRSTMYYQLTSWQAMYTPSFAVCKLYGGWNDAPATKPLVPGISPN
jgi:hypothetical protein